MKAMKKILAGIFVCLVAAACQPDEFPKNKPAEKVVPKLSGTWQLTTVIQQDNDAVNKGFPLFAQTQNITNDFPYSDLELVLNSDADGNPTTYAITLGDSPNIIGAPLSGNWTVDDVDFPSQIEFGTASIQLGSFAELNNGTMQFKLVRLQPKGDEMQAVVTYQYIFTKQ
jgi:hypothetical protein